MARATRPATTTLNAETPTVAALPPGVELALGPVPEPEPVVVGRVPAPEEAALDCEVLPEAVGVVALEAAEVVEAWVTVPVGAGSGDAF
jgi:hypothetical protein